MKIGHFGPTFIFPGKTVNFFGVKHVAPSSTLKMRKSHKKSARVYAYTHAYTQLRDGGGRSAPPGLIGLTTLLLFLPSGLSRAGSDELGCSELPI